MGSSNRYFEARCTFHAGRSSVWRAITEYLQLKIIDEPDSVLEIGPGYGDFINQVKVSRKIAVDIVDVSSHLAPDVEFHLADATDLSILGSNAVDTVFASNLFEHMTKENVEIALDEIHRVLRPDGLLVVIQPNFRLCYKRYFDDYTHRSIFTDESLCGILKCHNFEIAHRRNRFLPFSMYSLLPKSYWLTKLYLKLPILFMAKQMLVVGRKVEYVSESKS
ncbi:MAG: class I SAM-dependent methyltransferase [Desulfomonilaceae bacterium]